MRLVIPIANAIFTANNQAKVFRPPSVSNQSAISPAGLLNGGKRPA